MKYSISNTIERPLSVVSEKFRDPNGPLHWIEGLQEIVPISGTQGEVGGKRDMHSLYKNKKMTITETILEQDLPHRIKYKYESPMGSNIVELTFEEIAENKVKQTNNTEMKLKGFTKIIAPLFKGMFKNQSLKYLDGFKKFAEEDQ